MFCRTKCCCEWFSPISGSGMPPHPRDGWVGPTPPWVLKYLWPGLPVLRLTKTSKKNSSSPPSVRKESGMKPDDFSTDQVLTWIAGHPMGLERKSSFRVVLFPPPQFLESTHPLDVFQDRISFVDVQCTSDISHTHRAHTAIVPTCVQ